MTYRLYCDGCNVEPETGKVYENMTEAREALIWHSRQGGWLLKKGGEFLCPECVAGY